MTWKTAFRTRLNQQLERFNVQIVTRTAERAERIRLATMDKAGHFDSPVLPVLRQFAACDPEPMLKAISEFGEQLQCLSQARSDNDYCYNNDYFTSPDAEIAYAMVRQLQPKRIIEVGSGYSTKLFRKAIQDGNLDTRLISIDPSPRTAIAAIADDVIASRAEYLPSTLFVDNLAQNDVLFIDSSHQVRIGNDVIVLLLTILPQLSAGVVIHLHDIFLPYDYPREWIVENGWDWNEQYLVHALLQDATSLEVLWPGHFLQRTLPNFNAHFLLGSPGRASSLWLRKIQ